MPGDRKHIIQKQVLDFEWRIGKSDHSEFDEINRKFESDIRPAIEEVLNRSGDDGHIIRLEKVEIDLGTLSPDQYNENLASILADRLSEYLGRSIPPFTKDKELKKDGLEIISLTTSDIDTVIFFLQQGYFPWWGRFSSKELKEKVGEFVEQDSLEFRKSILEAMKEKRVLRRLAYTLEAERMNELTRFLYPHLKVNISGVVKELIGIIPLRIRREKAIVPEKGFEVVLTILSANAKATLEELIDKTTRYFLSGTKTGDKDVLKLFQKLQEKIEKAKSGHEKDFVAALGSLIETYSGKPARPGQKMIGEKPSVQPGEPKGEKEGTADSIEEEEKRILDKTMVRNGGIVLLWPYLEKLFETLGYVRKNVFTSEEAVNRAVLLLDLLGFGNGERDEDRMVLNKILCGTGLSLPVDLQMELKEEEIKEGGEVLEALIAHWKILKSTKPEGLREGFLQREGSLEPIEDNWKLTVKREGKDILLASLPFSISMIRLPWMNEMLIVEW